MKKGIMMFTYDQENLIEEMAETIRNLYGFSLIPTSEQFMEPEEITDKMGGGIIYKNTHGIAACRCGKSFLLQIQKETDKTTQLRFLTEALAVLFITLQYEVSENFLSNKNMEYCDILNTNNFDLHIAFANELLCPKKQLKYIVESFVDENSRFSLTEVSKKLGLSVNFIESRLKECGMINSW